MLLTAGLGTRLRPVTNHFAKPAVPFLNIPLMYYPLALIEELGISELVYNTHYKPEQVDLLAHRIPNAQFKVSGSPEVEKPLGSGGGIWNAKKFLAGHGSFVVSNGDEVILPHDPDVIQKFLHTHQSSGAIATILVMNHPLVGKQFGGVWTDSQGVVKGFGKNPSDFPGCQGLHYVGILLLSDRIFDYLPEGESNILYDALVQAIAKGELVNTFNSTFTWFETGNPHDYLEATAAALEMLDKNANRYDTEALKKIMNRFWSKGTSFKRDRDALILSAKSAELQKIQPKGFVVLGENVSANDSAATIELENVVALTGSRIDHHRANEIIV